MSLNTNLNMILNEKPVYDESGNLLDGGYITKSIKSSNADSVEMKFIFKITTKTRTEFGGVEEKYHEMKIIASNNEDKYSEETTNFISILPHPIVLPPRVVPGLMIENMNKLSYKIHKEDYFMRVEIPIFPGYNIGFNLRCLVEIPPVIDVKLPEPQPEAKETTKETTKEVKETAKDEETASKKNIIKETANKEVKETEMKRKIDELFKSDRDFDKYEVIHSFVYPDFQSYDEFAETDGYKYIVTEGLIPDNYLKRISFKNGHEIALENIHGYHTSIFNINKTFIKYYDRYYRNLNNVSYADLNSEDPLTIFTKLNCDGCVVDGDAIIRDDATPYMDGAAYCSGDYASKVISENSKTYSISKNIIPTYVHVNGVSFDVNRLCRTSPDISEFSVSSTIYDRNYDIHTYTLKYIKKYIAGYCLKHFGDVVDRQITPLIMIDSEAQKLTTHIMVSKKLIRGRPIRCNSLKGPVYPLPYVMRPIIMHDDVTIDNAYWKRYN